MTPPRSLIDNIVRAAWVDHPWRRRLVALVLLAVLLILALFPKEYRVAASLTPTDPSALGLGGALGQTGALSNVFGNQAAIEISLKVARSVIVRDKVIDRLDLIRTGGFKNRIAASNWLDHAVDIRSLRGGIIQMDMKTGDPAFGAKIISAFAQATRERLAEVAREQTAYKRNILLDLVRSASRRLDIAQAAFDQFRRRTRYSSPSTSIEAIGERVPALQTALKAKEVELNAARAFATDDNMTVRQILAEIGALRRQLAEAESLDASDPNSVNRVVVQSTQAQDLEREVGIARSLYLGYRRYLEGTAVEDLTSTSSVRMLEPTYTDTERQFRTLPAALFLLVLLGAAATEFYLMRPPLGTRRLMLEQTARG